MKKTVRYLTFSAVLAALSCVSCLLLGFPIAYGYVNPSDVFTLLAGFLLPMPYGIAAAALGGAIADLLLGYVYYAPATFVIKGVMALIAYLLVGRRLARKKKAMLWAFLAAGIASVWLALGYFAFEAVLYGFFAALPQVLLNLLQGVICSAAAIAVLSILHKRHIRT